MNRELKYSDGIMILSIIAAVISGAVSMTHSSIIDLAGTQWMLIAIVLGLYGIFVKLPERSK